MNQLFSRAAVMRAALVTTGSTYICFVLGMLSSVLVARALGPNDYGRYAYVIWLAGILIMVANNGLNVTGIKFISESLGRGQPEVGARIHGWLRRFQFLSLAGTLVLSTAILALPFARPAGWEGHVVWLIVAVNLATGFKALSMFNTSMAKGYGRFNIEAITNLAAAVTTVVGTAILSWQRADIYDYLLLFTASNLVYLLTSTWLMRRENLAPRSEKPDEALLVRVRPHLFWTVFLLLVAAASNRYIETLLLNAWVGVAEVGYFAIATGLSRAGSELLAAGLSSVVMPMMGYAFGSGDPKQIRRVFEDTTRYYQFLGLILAGGGWFWSDVLIELMYGHSYAAAAPVMRIMVLSSGLLLASAAATAVLANSDNQRFRTTVAIATLALTAVFAVALIPTLGVVGAALSQALATAVGFFLMVAGIQRHVGLSLPWGMLARQYGAALLAAAVGEALVLGCGPKLGSWLAGPVYGLFLIWVSVQLGVWRDNELQQASAYLSRLPRLKAIVTPLMLGKLP